MPVVLITGAARADSIAAGIVTRLLDEGWTVVTSDLRDADYPCDLADPDGNPIQLWEPRGPGEG